MKSPGLHLDCLVEILGRCELSDIASASCVSKSWNEAALEVLQGETVSSIGSHRLDSCTVMLAQSIPHLEISSGKTWETKTYVDAHESCGRVALVDDGGSVHVCARDGCCLNPIACIPVGHDDVRSDSGWKVFVLGGTRNILTISHRNHCCNVYVVVDGDTHSKYSLKHSFWPTSLISQCRLTFSMEESDPQYLYVGCDAGKVLQLDIFNQGAVSRVYRSEADSDSVTAMITCRVPWYESETVLIVATKDDSQTPYITLYCEHQEPSALACPSNSRYKELSHLDVCTDSGFIPLVLGTCGNVLLVWKIVLDTRLRLVYLTQTNITINVQTHCFLRNVCDDCGNVYACGMDMIDCSVHMYKISSTGHSMHQIHHVPVFGSNPMENITRVQEDITSMMWSSYPFVFLAGSAAGLVFLPRKEHRFSRPTSFLHVSFL